MNGPTAVHIAPAPVATNLLVYQDANGNVWARNQATGIARLLSGYVDIPSTLYVMTDGSRPMLGQLTLVAGGPIDALDATSKDYVDSGDRNLQDQINLLLAGTVFIGSYDVVNDHCVFTSAVGMLPGPLPLASSVPTGSYVICMSAGLGSGNAPFTLFKVGDQIISDGALWYPLGVGGPIVTAMQVAILPEINAWPDVQTALDALWTGKINKAGDIMSGALYLPSSAPTDPDQAITKAYVDLVSTQCVRKIGDVMTGSLQLPVGSFGQAALGIGGSDCGFSAQPPALFVIARTNEPVAQFDLSGLHTRGLDLWSQGKVVNMVNPTNAQDGTTKSYVDSYVNSQRDTRVAKTGDNMSGTLSVTMAATGDGRNGAGTQGLRLLKTEGNNTVCPAVQWTDNGGNGVAFIRGRQSGGWAYYTINGTLEAFQSAGGYSQVRIFTTRNSGPAPDMMFDGTVYARGTALTSDAALKTRIATPGADELERAFAALRPVRFHWAPGQIDNPLAAPEGRSQLADPEPDRLEWGFLAQDIEAGIPGAVHDGDQGHKAYELGNVVAVLTAKVRQLEEARAKDSLAIEGLRAEQARALSQLREQQVSVLTEFQARVSSLGEQLASLEERFSNKIMADMELQLAAMRERSAKPKEVRRPPQLPE